MFLNHKRSVEMFGRFLSFLIFLLISFSVTIKPVLSECVCNYSVCALNCGGECDTDPNNPYTFMGAQYPDQGDCTDISTCYEFNSSGERCLGSYSQISCSQCSAGYGYGFPGSGTFSTCLPSCGSGGTEPPNPECWEGEIDYGDATCDPSDGEYSDYSLFTRWYTWGDGVYGKLREYNYEPSDTLKTNSLSFNTSQCVDDCTCGQNEDECGHCGSPTNYNTEFFGKCGGSPGEIPGRYGGCDNYFTKDMTGYLHVTETGLWDFKYEVNAWGDTPSTTSGAMMLSLYMEDVDEDGDYDPACTPDESKKIQVVGWWEQGSGNVVGSLSTSGSYPTDTVTRDNINLNEGWYPIHTQFAYRGLTQSGSDEDSAFERINWRGPGSGSFTVIPDSVLKPDDFFSGNCSLSADDIPGHCVDPLTHAPTATISCPVPATISPTSAAGIFTVNASDVDPLDTLNISLMRRACSPNDATCTSYLDPYTQVGGVTRCLSNNCSIPFTTTPSSITAGWWRFYPNVTDSSTLSCTGKPGALP
ncbi:MAG: hypothetical protein ACD_22C00237G0017, partial [uncultured bacterium]